MAKIRKANGAHKNGATLRESLNGFGAYDKNKRLMLIEVRQKYNESERVYCYAPSAYEAFSMAGIYFQMGREMLLSEEVLRRPADGVVIARDSSVGGGVRVVEGEKKKTEKSP